MLFKLAEDREYSLLVVEEVMRQVVADVAEDATAVDGRRGVPVVEEDGMGELPERCSEDEEECRWHDESETVHGEIVVDAVKEEVQRERHAIVREVVVKMEETAMEAILDDCPDTETNSPVGGKRRKAELKTRDDCDVRDRR